jgi:hypothetical protein
VGGEHDVRVGGAQPVGPELDERRVVVPAVEEEQLRAVDERVLDLGAVAADRHPRVVRREHEPDDRGRSARERAVHGVGNPRRPVLHPREDGQPQLPLERGPRPLRDLVQRVPILDPEPSVAGGQILQ